MVVFSWWFYRSPSVCRFGVSMAIGWRVGFAVGERNGSGWIDACDALAEGPEDWSSGGGL